jgi:anaerobic magnesium-protoporphyrin IX monomethyl ester cyclase
MSRKILFINAVNYRDEEQRHFPPQGLGYLVSSLRQHYGEDYFDVRMIDSNVAYNIGEWQPEIVCITAVSENWNYAKEYARIAKQYGATVIVGGMHVSALPETITRDMDVTVIGEGETAILEAVNMSHGVIRAKEFVKLDDLALPARESYNLKNDEGYITTARGCPYKCVFCASTRYWPLRFNSPEYVIRGLDRLVNEFHYKRIVIWDDMFSANLPRLNKIADLLEDTNIPHKVSFTCQTRANTITPDVAKLFKRMNIDAVCLGLESGCARTLDYLKGDSVTVEDNERAIGILREYGIKPIGSFIIGSPSETKAEILETLAFIKRTGLQTFNVYLLVPLPGTPIWDYAESKQKVSSSMDFSRLGMGAGDIADPVIVSETMTLTELKSLHKLFLREKSRRKVMSVVRNPMLAVKYAGDVKAVMKRVMSGKGAFSQ